MISFTRNAKRQVYVIVGLFGLALIAVFLTTGVLLRTLSEDTISIYQVITGVSLTLLITYQWVLLFVRVFGGNIQSHYKAHRWVGVAVTILFAFHPISFGHGWTNTLTVVFCHSAITGLLNREIIVYRKR